MNEFNFSNHTEIKRQQGQKFTNDNFLELEKVFQSSIDQIISNDITLENLSDEELDLLKNLKKNRNLPFAINPQYIFQLNKINSIERKIKYLNHRYRVYKANVLRNSWCAPSFIEPVSACNLRCPMCFQIDKTFTKKPYMGIMDFNLLLV